MVTNINNFLHGAVMMSSLVAGLFFLKFWNKTKDAFFGFFALAFTLMAVERLFLLFIDTQNEARTYVYVFRLMAYLMIIWAVIIKNGKSSS